MDEIKNPIAELHKVLTSLRNAHESTTTVDVLARVFVCQADDLPSILEGLKSILDLIKESKQAAEKFIPGENARFIEPIDRINTMMSSMNLSKSWSTSKSFLVDKTMDALDFGGYALAQFYPAAKPENVAKIRDFIEKLDELLEECLSSDLSDELKKLFSKHLETLRAALLRYRLDGSVEVDETMDTIVGSLLRHKDSILAEPEENEKIIGKFFDILGKVNDLISGYQSAAQLAAPAATVLLRHIIN